MESKQELLPPAQTVAAFDEFRSQLNELQVGNSKAVFDYRDKKGNKEARSHIDKLRTTKAAIEKKRVSEKEEFLVKGRLVDADAKYLTAVVQSMIEVHETPLKEIENEEKRRVEAIKQRIESLSTYKVYGSGGDKQVYIDELKSVKAFVIDESLGEFQLDAAKAKESAIAYLEQYIIDREKYEAEQAELARLRAESLAREQKDREERIARESAESARIAAEQAAANAIRDAQLATERAQREKAESEAREKQAVIDAQARELAQKQAAELASKQAEERAEQQRLQAIADTESRIAREAAVAKAEADKLAANTAHRTKVKKAAKESFIALGFTEAVAIDLVKDILAGKVAGVTLNF
jgi:hypothetical protein